MKEKMRKSISEVSYSFLSIMNRIVPKNTKGIFIYDGPFMRQNCWALFSYLVDNGYDKKYEITFFTNQKSNITNDMLQTSSILKGAWKRLKARYVFFEYDNFKLNCKKNDQQLCFNIWHGMPIKKIGYLSKSHISHPYEDDYTYCLATSLYFKDIMKRVFHLSDSQVYLGGYPRNDYLIKEKPKSKHLLMNCKNYIWMPTFRTSTANGFSDSGSENALPFVNETNIHEFDEFLHAKHISVIIKLHPFQDKVEWLKANTFKNITIINNKDIFEEGLELYEFIGQMDGLITDYSSVFFDYLITGKPTLFAIDDYESYKEKRGFIDESIFDYIKMPVARSYEQFCDMLTYRMQSPCKQDLEALRLRFAISSVSGSFTKDILDFVGISL